MRLKKWDKEQFDRQLKREMIPRRGTRNKNEWHVICLHERSFSASPSPFSSSDMLSGNPAHRSPSLLQLICLQCVRGQGVKKAEVLGLKNEQISVHTWEHSATKDFSNYHHQLDKVLRFWFSFKSGLQKVSIPLIWEYESINPIKQSS